jgi:hypothetical protein
MIPIYEQGSGNGIGHGLQSFLRRFDEICAEHLAKGRAKSFAFIFYDFTDQAIRKVLKNQGVFAQLDRLSGKELSVFYLHAGTKAAVEAFNAHFFGALGIEGQATLPCAVFFRVQKGAIEDVEIAGRCAMKPRSAGHLNVEAVEKPLFEPQKSLRMARSSSRHFQFAA